MFLTYYHTYIYNINKFNCSTNKQSQLSLRNEEYRKVLIFMKKITIIGAGNGGQAFAAYLSLKGHTVKIYDVAEDTVNKLNYLGGIILEGHSDVTGFGKIALATTDMKVALQDAEIVLVTLPSIYHKSTAEKMAPHLQDGQYVVLNPAAGLGILETKKAFDENGCKANVKLACTSTLLFACRMVEVGKVKVSGQKTKFSAAALPASANKEFAELFADIIPEIDFSYDVIRVTLDNLNAIAHPGPTLLYTNVIERGLDFRYYLDLTPTQGRLMDKMDEERVAIANAFGIEVRSFVDEFKGMYPTEGKTAYEVITNCDAYGDIGGQKSVNTRYFQEDIPYALEAFRAMAQVAGVKTPIIDSVVCLARAVVDDIAEGRNAKNLGIAGMSKQEFLKLCLG